MGRRVPQAPAQLHPGPHQGTPFGAGGKHPDADKAHHRQRAQRTGGTARDLAGHGQHLLAAQRVEPIVVSLRAHADQVVEAELQRLRLRVPDLDDDAAEEVARSLRRAVSTLLHTPTVRMKELASDPDGTRYATALHRLFDLDPEAIEALSAAQDAGADPTVAQLLEGPS